MLITDTSLPIYGQWLNALDPILLTMYTSQYDIHCSPSPEGTIVFFVVQELFLGYLMVRSLAPLVNLVIPYRTGSIYSPKSVSASFLFYFFPPLPWAILSFSVQVNLFIAVRLWIGGIAIFFLRNLI